ncbi:MAG: DNA polymerase I, partial [Gammaproteobacteria bacterium]|nr:DNA polymerase I [Gammaproteobacteria bacterium]
MKTKQLILIDGSSYLYRAFHALPNLSTSNGQATGAVYGVINMVRKLVQEHRPDYVAVVFDAKGKTFRDELYPDYKANRPPMPDELASQIPLLYELVEALGLPLLSVPGVEADDVIATLAEQARNAGINTLVSTGDKDMAQIVSAEVLLIDTMQDIVFDRARIKQKFGVPPERIVDYLTLVGDVSDNVPGVPKVGPKTAAKWLAEYGTLDDLMTQADQLTGKVGENFREALTQLPRSRELVTVKRDLDLDVSPTDLTPGAPDTEALKALYARLEFRAWLKELGGLEDVTTAGADDYEIILEEAALERWAARLQRAALIAFDTETTSLDAVSARLVGMSFAIESGDAAYVPIGHDYPDAPNQLPRARVLEKLGPILEDPNRPKVGQNLKYDHVVLQGEGIELRGIRFDTMLESYVLDSVASRHDMDGLAMKHLGYKTISFEEVAGKGKAQVTFNQVPVGQAGRYAAEDADVTLRLHEVLWPKLAAEPRLKSLFETIEMPLVTVLARMERIGVKIDRQMLARQSQELAHRIEALESEAHTLAGDEFNIGSPKQIQRILFENLKLPVLRKTPKGQPSTAEQVLQELAQDYDLPRLILEHRGLSKLKSTYTDKLPAMINPVTGRVHTSYHQAVAATGRLSSADPNLQNIPIRTAEGRRIREAFIPEAGCVLL